MIAVQLENASALITRKGTKIVTFLPLTCRFAGHALAKSADIMASNNLVGRFVVIDYLPVQLQQPKIQQVLLTSVNESGDLFAAS